MAEIGSHPAVTADEQAVLRALANAPFPPTLASFRAKHWDRRSLIDGLLARGLLSIRTGRLSLSLTGMYAADLDSIRDLIAHFNGARPVLRRLYLRNPDRPEATMEELLQLADDHSPVDRERLRHALNTLVPELDLASTIATDGGSGNISAFTLRESVMDTPPLPMDGVPIPVLEGRTVMSQTHASPPASSASARRFRAPPNDRIKGVLRLVVADVFTHSQLGEVADLLRVPEQFRGGSTKSERVGNMIRSMNEEQLQELVALALGAGYVRPTEPSDGVAAARLELADTCEFRADSYPYNDVVKAPVPPAASMHSLPVAEPPLPVLVERSLRPPAITPPTVFVVHGHDEAARESVARLVERLGFTAIVLQDEPNKGNTVIEKFEAHADGAAFAIVVLTPDDIGSSAAAPAQQRARARQNVILELGYFMGALGRSKVCALHKGELELPSDYGGVAYVPLDKPGAWRLQLAKEMKAAGLSVDLNRI